MFYLRKIGGWDTKAETTVTGDEFGWWIGDRGAQNSVSPKGRANFRSSNSFTSKISYVNPDESENLGAEHELPSSRLENITNCKDNEGIELNLLKTEQHDIDVDLIEKDAGHFTNRSNESTNNDVNNALRVEEISRSRGHSYTPERLVRTQNYRILIPPPRFHVLPNRICNADILQPQHHRNKLDEHLDSSFIDTSHRKSLLGLSDTEMQASVSFSNEQVEGNEVRRKNEIQQAIQTPVNTQKTTNSTVIQTLKRNTSTPRERICRFRKELTNYNISHIQHKLPVNTSLDVAVHVSDKKITEESRKIDRTVCDELLMLSENTPINSITQQNEVTNEGVMILNTLENDSNHSTTLLEEDTFYDANSSHDHFTRLASTIEPDGKASTVTDDPNELVSKLHNKVNKLENTNKDIYKEFRLLKKNLPENITINEVFTVLNTLGNNSNNSASLLEEDRFYDANSSHDHLTRLALTIEPDGNIPAVVDDPNEMVWNLNNKVDKLHESNNSIGKEILLLKEDFQQDEQRVNHLSAMTKELREDVDEMKYLDDLLSMLQGELERISRRNWPFALRHTLEQTEDINLVI